MGLFKPTAAYDRVTDITTDMLKKLNIKAIFLDVDNTVASYISKEPIDGSLAWVNRVKASGVLVYIVSNNYKDRVSRISKKFNLPFISFAMKPLPVGFIKAKRKLKIKSRECLVVGDQIFTDILGANLCAMKSVLLKPIEEETGFSFKARRKLEKNIRAKLNNGKFI